jgi:hypothetical protein
VATEGLRREAREGRDAGGRRRAGYPQVKREKNNINKIVLLPTLFYFAGLTVRADLTGCYADVASSVWAACGNPKKLGPVFRHLYYYRVK